MKKGFFVSCRQNKEQKGLREITRKLQILIESSVRMHKVCRLEEQLQDEIEEYKNHSKFVKLMEHRCILVIENKSHESSVSLFNKLRETNTIFEYVHRVIPLERIFRIDDAKIIEGIQGLEDGKSYKIVYEERMCSEGVKKRVFDVITKNICLKVDLETPDYIIAVQVFKSMFGMSVVMNEHKNFSFSAV
ncbi:hypothetical protein CWI42_100250 [Ordospora colligata]|uniref:THUMP domain-containing protein n=1 Tax=Ordospora colligata OC4 TaxID=1354746 RepID=A0A0B2UD92_9MICR|nr:uncharacterized protein M896_100250 [Ordospora colligata OC4]KHN69041.1 hypothetical protein M896_100250 [Ordospora colligata OC4]TBU14322.1 hypothetical protein CWI40_100260 [Ordospora colligata]TBU14387.1 hypothetical protein CWI41_100260 [Ordospora colligata]TBU17948.1 hypothetical protein CWI42_100250 [Ordospora colligata]